MNGIYSLPETQTMKSILLIESDAVANGNRWNRKHYAISNIVPQRRFLDNKLHGGGVGTYCDEFHQVVSDILDVPVFSGGTAAGDGELDTVLSLHSNHRVLRRVHGGEGDGQIAADIVVVWTLDDVLGAFHVVHQTQSISFGENIGEYIVWRAKLELLAVEADHRRQRKWVGRRMGYEGEEGKRKEKIEMQVRSLHFIAVGFGV